MLDNKTARTFRFHVYDLEPNVQDAARDRPRCRGTRITTCRTIRLYCLSVAGSETTNQFSSFTTTTRQPRDRSRPVGNRKEMHHTSEA